MLENCNKVEANTYKNKIEIENAKNNSTASASTANKKDQVYLNSELGKTPVFFETLAHLVDYFYQAVLEDCSHAVFTAQTVSKDYFTDCILKNSQTLQDCIESSATALRAQFDYTICEKVLPTMISACNDDQQQVPCHYYALVKNKNNF